SPSDIPDRRWWHRLPARPVPRLAEDPQLCDRQQRTRSRRPRSRLWRRTTLRARIELTSVPRSAAALRMAAQCGELRKRAGLTPLQAVRLDAIVQTLGEDGRFVLSDALAGRQRGGCG